MDIWQKLISGGLAIIVTLLTYQNTQHKDQIMLLSQEVEALNIGVISSLYMDYNEAFIKNDFSRIASHFQVPVNFAANKKIAKTSNEVVSEYKDMKANIQEGYAYSVINDVTINRQSDNSYLLCADFTRFNKQKEVLFEGRAEYLWVNVAKKGWKMNYLKGIDRGYNQICTK